MGTAAGTEGGHRRVEWDAATVAPPLPLALQAQRSASPDAWADARGLHASSARAARLLDAAREELAALLGVRPGDVSLPPDRTAAVNAAVLGCAAPGRAAGGPVVVTAVEHSSVLHAARWAAGSPEQVRTVGVDRSGHVDLEQLRAALPGARLACVQHANVEIGTVQDLAPVHALCREAGVPLLVDASASLGHVPAPTGFDVLVASPPAWGSVAGTGLLAVRPGVRWRAHEPGEAGASRRPGEHAGEVDVAAVLAAAVSLRSLVQQDLAERDPRHAMVGRLRAALAAAPDTDVVGDPVRRLPHVLTVSALYLPGEELVRACDGLGFSVGSGSACTSDTLAPSHVLAAVGALTHGNVRIGLARGTTDAEVDAFAAAWPGLVAGLRRRLGVDDL